MAYRQELAAVFGRLPWIAAGSIVGPRLDVVIRRNCQQARTPGAARSEALAYLADVAVNSAGAIDSSLLGFGAGGRCPQWPGYLAVNFPAKPPPASSGAPRAS